MLTTITGMLTMTAVSLMMNHHLERFFFGTALFLRLGMMRTLIIGALIISERRLIRITGSYLDLLCIPWQDCN